MKTYFNRGNVVIRSRNKTDEDVQKVRQLAELGKNSREISEMTGIKRLRVCQLANYAGIKLNRKWKPEQVLDPEKMDFFVNLLFQYKDGFWRCFQNHFPSTLYDPDALVNMIFLHFCQYENRKLSPIPNIRAWVFSVGFNEFGYKKNSIKVKNAISLEYAETISERETSCKCGTETVDNRLDCETILGWLPDEDAQILRLYFLEERTLSEIGKMMGLSLSCVYRRLESRIEYLRELAKQRGIYSDSGFNSGTVDDSSE